MYLLFLFAISLFVAFVCTQISDMVHFAGAYGHMLSKMKMRSAELASKSLGVDQYNIFRYVKEAAYNAENHDQAMEIMDDYYESIAHKSGEVKLWTCPWCILARMCAISSLVLILGINILGFIFYNFSLSDSSFYLTFLLLPTIPSIAWYMKKNEV